MAELVQAALDDMVAPLRDLMDRGIFSELEIKAIVSRRREYEYLLRRRVARKADFLRYLETEIELEKLRKIRTRKLIEQQRRKDKNNSEKPKIPERLKNGGLPIGDVHIIQLIHLLFVRVIRKFKSDVSLHLQHAAFAKESKSYHKLTTIYTEALQIHPRNTELWIEAASHEFFGYSDPVTGQTNGGGSIQGARILMQRALRINPKSQDLWVQYFCLELHFIQKLRGRREILRLSSQDDDEEKTNINSEEIPKIVYKNAIDTIADDVAFRMKFMDACRSFPHTEKIEEFINSSLEKDFSDKPEAWIAKAIYQSERMQKRNEKLGFMIDRSSEEDQPPNAKKQRLNKTNHPVLKTLCDAVKELPTAEMYLSTIQFACEYMDQNMNSRAEVKEFIDNLSEEIEFDILTPDLVLELSNYFTTYHQNTEKSIQILKDFSTKKKNDISITLQHVKLLKNNSKISEAVIELQRCVNNTPVHSPQHTQLLLELFGAIMVSRKINAQHSLHPRAIFEKILLFAPTKNPTFDPIFGVGSVANACLYFLQQSNTNSTPTKKEVIDIVIEQSTYCDSARDKSLEEIQAMVSFFDAAIDYNNNTDTKREKNKSKSKQRLFVYRLFDKAIDFFETCAPDIADRYKDMKAEFKYI